VGGDVLGHHAGHGRFGVAHGEAVGLGPPGQDAGTDDEDGKTGQGEEGERPVQGEEHEPVEGDAKDSENRLRDGVDYGLVDGGQVGGEVGHGVADPGAAEVVGRQALELGEHPQSEVVEHPGAEVGVEVVPAHGGQGGDDHGHAHAREDGHQQFPVAGGDGLVDDHTEGQRHGGVEGEVDEQAEHQQGDLQPVGTQVPVEGGHHPDEGAPPAFGHGLCGHGVRRPRHRGGG
jgi:hypothetical protein